MNHIFEYFLTKKDAESFPFKKIEKEISAIRLVKESDSMTKYFPTLDSHSLGPVFSLKASKAF